MKGNLRKKFIILSVAAWVILTPWLYMSGSEVYGAFAREVCGWQEGDSVAVVPASASKLPDYAFADCKSLAIVKFESGMRLTEVGEYAFLGCGKLRDIELPGSVRSLGTGCFMECVALRRLDVPRDVMVLPRYFAAWCGSLEEVDLPLGLKDIGSHAFAYCGSLRAVAIPDGVEHIGSNVWSRCFSLEEVRLPDSVTELESYTFSDCVSLRKVRLPGNDKMLGELLFNGCKNLQEIEEPSPIPPTFDCGSPLFDPDEALPAGLIIKVPHRSLRLYRKADVWCRYRDELRGTS